MMSGIMASHAIVRVVQQRLDEMQAIQSYNRWMQDWFEHDQRRLSELYRTLRTDQFTSVF
jgi:hypothetical protein